MITVSHTPVVHTYLTHKSPPKPKQPSSNSPPHKSPPPPTLMSVISVHSNPVRHAQWHPKPYDRVASSRTYIGLLYSLENRMPPPSAEGSLSLSVTRSPSALGLRPRVDGGSVSRRPLPSSPAFLSPHWVLTCIRCTRELEEAAISERLSK